MQFETISFDNIIRRLPCNIEANPATVTKKSVRGKSRNYLWSDGHKENRMIPARKQQEKATPKSQRGTASKKS